MSSGSDTGLYPRLCPIFEAYIPLIIEAKLAKFITIYSETPIKICRIRKNSRKVGIVQISLERTLATTRVDEELEQRVDCGIGICLVRAHPLIECRLKLITVKKSRINSTGNIRENVR